MIVPILKIFAISLSLFQIIDSLQINNSADIKLGETQTYAITKGCQEVRIPINYKRLVLNVESNNLQRVVITDKKISYCDGNKLSTSCCSKNSTFCMENDNPVKNEFRLNYCTDYTYVYACGYESISQLRILQEEVAEPPANVSETNTTMENNTNPSPVVTPTSNNTNSTSSTFTPTNSTLINNMNSTSEIPAPVPTNSTIIKNETKPVPPIASPNGPGSLTLTTSIIKGQGCITTENFEETKCSSLGIEACQDKQSCSPKCSYVECRKERNDPYSKVFSLCLPSQLNDLEMISRCKNHIDFVEPEQITPQLYRKDCNKEISMEDEEVQKESSHSFFKFLLVIFGVIVLTTFIASVYYRFKVSIDGVPPFEPPSIFPNFIFPRQTNYF